MDPQSKVKLISGIPDGNFRDYAIRHLIILRQIYKYPGTPATLATSLSLFLMRISDLKITYSDNVNIIRPYRKTA